MLLITCLLNIIMSKKKDRFFSTREEVKNECFVKRCFLIKTAVNN